MLCVPPDMYEKRLFSVLLTEKEKTKWELVNTKSGFMDTRSFKLQDT